MSEPIIKVTDIAWARLRSPDLDTQEEFLTAFGMQRSARTDKALYMRGTDHDHHIHITELGEPAFLGLAFWAASEQDLHKLSTNAQGASPVEDIDEPGGGKRVVVKDHNGFNFEIVWGVERLDPLDVRKEKLNIGTDKNARVDRINRLQNGPAQVKRIGHGVISTPHVDASVAWLHDTLGFIVSDDVHAEEDPDKLLASFNRTDCGPEFVDHHICMYALTEVAGLNHLGYEVQDIDDVAIGQKHLQSFEKYRHIWGMGRHKLGSQVFDYWKDPWDRMHEHWTDSDVFNVASGSNKVPASKGFGSQWGTNAPQEFRDTASK